jgi:hypothetical protein
LVGRFAANTAGSLESGSDLLLLVSVLVLGITYVTHLIAAGERVLRVAPKLMGVSRRGEREPGKSDQIDARAIARAVLRDDIERFPTAYLDEDAVEIRLLCDHRDTVVNERTRLINRLRINLVIVDPELEAKSHRASSTTLRSCSASGAGFDRCLKPQGFGSASPRADTTAIAWTGAATARSCHRA